MRPLSSPCFERAEKDCLLIILFSPTDMMSVQTSHGSDDVPSQDGAKSGRKKRCPTAAGGTGAPCRPQGATERGRTTQGARRKAA